MDLFFDTETTGLPLNRNARNHDVGNWPRLVQLAWAVCDDAGEKLIERDRIIIPQGFSIPGDAYDIHGISDDIALENGINLRYALAEFLVAVQLCDHLIGHGIYFDKSIVGAEYIRRGKEDAYEALKGMRRTCTMQKSVKHCMLPHLNGRKGYKWPKLEELHNKLFGEGFGDAHNASADLDATIRCYNELKKLGVL